MPLEVHPHACGLQREHPAAYIVSVLLLDRMYFHRALIREELRKDPSTTFIANLVPKAPK